MNPKKENNPHEESRLNIKILRYEKIVWKDAEWFQSKNLKKIKKIELEKLKKSFIRNGFNNPFFVFEKNKTIYILDGHHRRLALESLQETVNIPNKLPALFMDIKSR